MALVRIASVALVGALVAWPRPGHACSCMPPDPPEVEVTRAAAVFVGTVVGLRLDRNGEAWARLRVDRRWKGALARHVLVRSPLMCGLNLEIGGSYLLYADRRRGALEMSVCNRWSDLEESLDEVALLDRLNPAGSNRSGR